MSYRAGYDVVSAVSALIATGMSGSAHLPTWWTDVAVILDEVEEAFAEQFTDDMTLLRADMSSYPHLISTLGSLTELGRSTQMQIRYARRVLASRAGDPGSTPEILAALTSLSHSLQLYVRRSRALLMDTVNMDLGVAG